MSASQPEMSQTDTNTLTAKPLYKTTSIMRVIIGDSTTANLKHSYENLHVNVADWVAVKNCKKRFTMFIRESQVTP